MALLDCTPKTVPSKNPPKASRMSSQETCGSEKSLAGSCASFRITAKITTATPSLNSDSPAIFVSNDLGTLAFFRMLNTAIGSVGEIRAPNSKQ
ncbi:hypothetical protein D3C86_1250570 [compost metagenome]